MKKWIAAFVLVTVCLAQPPAMAQQKAAVKPSVNTPEEIARLDAYEAQLEKYLVHYLSDEYDERAKALWNRDYSSPAALERSVEPNRRAWEAVISPPRLTKTAPLEKRPHQVDEIKAEWIVQPLGIVTAEAVLAFPKGASAKRPVPLIVVQHGNGSSPETPFRDGGYHAYAKALLKAGYAVLCPLNLRSTERRNNIEHLCRLAGTSLPGIELARLQHLLDTVLADPRIDAGKVGMWGVSLGGMATMFFMPLEPRIKAGIVSAWYNHRINKMAVKDERYSSFQAGNENYAFMKGWLTGYSDHDVVSLIAPRPLMIQHGKKDNIAYWPQVEEEFKKGRQHYERLQMAGRMELTLHEGGHEAIVEPGIRFLDKWLKGKK
ncbi:alpha/beta hydrolase family protein [Chitinophaga sp. 22620]|uniref:alpha/beta hydrolase family protein n=1 Tax=Chitinophaga sp. 22620 TaxID=3453952 RepID=UPI003F846F0D